MGTLYVLYVVMLLNGTFSASCLSLRTPPSQRIPFSSGRIIRKVPSTAMRTEYAPGRKNLDCSSFSDTLLTMIPVGGPFLLEARASSRDALSSENSF